MLLYSTSNRYGAKRVHNWRLIIGWIIKEGFPEEVMAALCWKEEQKFADNERKLDLDHKILYMYCA